MAPACIHEDLFGCLSQSEFRIRKRRYVPSAASESQTCLGCFDAWHLNQPPPRTCYCIHGLLCSCSTDLVRCLRQARSKGILRLSRWALPLVYLCKPRAERRRRVHMTMNGRHATSVIFFNTQRCRCTMACCTVETGTEGTPEPNQHQHMSSSMQTAETVGCSFVSSFLDGDAPDACRQSSFQHGLHDV